MSQIKLRESASFGVKALKVDREKQVIYGVKVIGEESRNGKVFPASTRQAAHRLIEGLKVNVNHRKMGEEAMVASRLGRFKNPREEADGTYADLHYLTTNPVTPMLIEAAERDPGLFGISILGNGKGTKKDTSGRKIVEAITNLESADLVSDPANTNGLHESVSTIEIAEVGEVETESCEVMLGKLIGKLIEEERHDEADAHMKVHKKHAAKKEGEADEGEDEAGMVEESTKEAVRANCLRLCETAGVKPVEVLVSALSASKPAARAKIIQKWSGVKVEKAVSGASKITTPGDDASELRETAKGQQAEAVSSFDRIMAQLGK